MSKFSQREAIYIEAELEHWHALINTDHVEGFVKWSNNPKEYVIGAKYMILNCKLTLYPESKLFGEEHFIAESQPGRFFILRKSSAVVR